MHRIYGENTTELTVIETETRAKQGSCFPVFLFSTPVLSALVQSVHEVSKTAGDTLHGAL